MRLNQELKNQALASLKGHWGKAILAFVTLYAILLPFAIVNNRFEGWGSIVYLLFTLLAMPVLSVGSVWSYLALRRGDARMVRNIFAGFRRYGHVLGGFLLMYLILMLWLLIYILPFCFYMGDCARQEIAPNWVVLLCLVPLAIPGYIACLRYGLVPFFLLDRPEMKAVQTLKESKRMMKGHKWELFLLLLSFIGWYLLMVVMLIGVMVAARAAQFGSVGGLIITLVLLLGMLVGLLFLMAYYCATFAAYYEHLTAPASEESTPEIPAENVES